MLERISIGDENLTHTLRARTQVQEPHHFDIRSRPRQISTNTGTKDLQMINISLRVLTRPELKSLPQLFKDYGRDYLASILPSIGNEVLKAVVAQYNADELLTKRDTVSRTIAQDLTSRAKEFGLQIDDVSITHLTFGPEFTAAIEAKQVAQQESERAKFVVMRAEQERRAAIIDAEGQSEAAQHHRGRTQTHVLVFSRSDVSTLLAELLVHCLDLVTCVTCPVTIICC